jgi:hypothetical protein
VLLAVIVLGSLAVPIVGSGAQEPLGSAPLADVGLVMDEVEPGVRRVLNDGVRDLSPARYVLPPTPPDRRHIPEWSTFWGRISAGPDGSVWLFWPDRFYRLGDPATHDIELGSLGFGDEVEVDPEGRVWLARGYLGEDHGASLTSFDGSSWTSQRDDIVAFDLHPDGTAWVIDYDGNLLRRDKDGWATATTDMPSARPNLGFFVSPVVHDYFRDFFELPAATSEFLVQDLYDFGGQGNQPSIHMLGEGPGHHFIGPSGALPAELRNVDMADDGDYWMYQVLDIPLPGPGSAGEEQPTREVAYLTHVEGGPMTVYGQESGVPVDVYAFNAFAAAPDGSIWMAAPLCTGLLRFDGTAWSRYLKGRCVHSMDIAPDGRIWLQASAPGPRDSDDFDRLESIATYVVSPDAPGTSP